MEKMTEEPEPMTKHRILREVLAMKEDYVPFRSVPHGQRGERLLKRGGIDCQECAILQSWRNALGALTLSAMLCGLACVVWRVVPTHTYIGEARTGTPVGRKVKLSD